MKTLTLILTRDQLNDVLQGGIDQFMQNSLGTYGQFTISFIACEDNTNYAVEITREDKGEKTTIVPGVN